MCGLAGCLTVRVGTGKAKSKYQHCCFLCCICTSCSFNRSHRPCSLLGTPATEPFTTGPASSLQYLLTLLCGCPPFLPFHSQTLIFSLSLLQTAESWLIFSVLSLCVPLPHHSDSPPADISGVFVH